MRPIVKTWMKRGALVFGFIGAFVVALNSDSNQSYSFLKHPAETPFPVAHADTPPVYGQASYYSEGSYNYSESSYGGDSGSGSSGGEGEGCGGGGCGGEGDGEGDGS